MPTSKTTLGLACLLIVGLSLSVPATRAAPQDEEQDVDLNQFEELAENYLDAFQESGVPTASAVDSAWQRAESANTIDTWRLAAMLANSYGNVVGVLADHYGEAYFESRSPRDDGDRRLLKVAADYEEVQIEYLALRNAAFLRMAQLYRGQGDRARALGVAVTVMELSGAEPNREGEALIRELIEYPGE